MSVDRLKDIEETQLKLEIEKQLTLQKALESKDADSIFKAQQYIYSLQQKDKDRVAAKSIFIDPFTLNTSSGFLEKNTSISYGVLRNMARTPIARAVIGTRKEQVAEFATPQRDKYSTGFVVRKKLSGLAKDEKEYNKLSKEEQKEIDYVVDFLMNCGVDGNKWHMDTFDSFIRKIVEDSLTYDQLTYEIVRDRRGKLSEFIATDASTMRIADSYDDDVIKREKYEPINGYYPSYVQVYQGRIVAEFYPWELCFGVRNPQTDILNSAYGRSELEDLINVVTNLLNADKYNANYFRIGSNPKGMFRVSGDVNQSRLDEFKQYWLADMVGANNAHKTPFIQADKMDFISTQLSNKDMEYAKYQEFLIKVFCAIYKISPEEIGFPLDNTPKLSKGSNREELQYSKDKGLSPLLRFVEEKINKYIVSPLTDGKYEFAFVGYNVKTAEEELGDDIKKVSNFKTINEIREGRGLKPIKGGDIVLNPVYMQSQQMSMMGDSESNDFVEDEEFDFKEEGRGEDVDNPFAKSAQKSIEEIFNS